VRHFYQSIRGWCDFEPLYAEMVRAAPARGAWFVEVGAYLGKSTAYMAVEIANSGKDIRFDVIDTWKGSAEHGDCRDVRDGTLYQQFLANMAPVRWLVRPVVLDSLSAARAADDALFDFVFIDASHRQEDVCRDIKAWLPKVKTGGVLAGHDILYPTVAEAVAVTLGEAAAEPCATCPTCWRVTVGRSQ
jgi:predicted O-methyltransferase YrrM